MGHLDEQPLTVAELLRKGAEARRESRTEDAAALFRSAVDLCRKQGLREELAHALGGLGQLERDRGNEPAAIEHYTDASEIWRSLNQPLRIAHTVRHVGDLHRHAGRTAEAERCYSEALELYRAHAGTQPLDLANALRGFGLLKEQIGDFAGAAAVWSEAADLYAAAGVEKGAAESRRHTETDRNASPASGVS